MLRGPFFRGYSVYSVISTKFISSHSVTKHKLSRAVSRCHMFTISKMHRPLYDVTMTFTSIAELLLFFTRNVSYLDCLHVLSLETPEHCCLIHDLIVCYKYLHSLIDTDNRNFWCVQLSPRTRNNGLKLDKTHCNSDARKAFFTNRIVDIWNSLPAAVVLRHNVSAFKSHLKEFNFYRFFCAIHSCFCCCICFIVA